MKKIISLVLAVSLLLTMLFSATFTVNAATTANDITVDLTKVYRIGTDEGKGITLTTTNLDDGSVSVAFSNYKVQLFNSDGSIPTSQIWINGGILALKNSNDEFIILQSGTKYSINVIYDVTSVGTSDTTYQPQIGLVRNNHSSSTTGDNGTVIYTAKKHSAIGSYSLSYQTTPNGNQPLRLAFGGHGAITIKSITIKAITHSFYEAKAIDLTNVEPIGVSNASYSNFTPATDSTPMSLDVNATYAYNATLFDGTNTWINTWTTMYLKTLIPLKYDADNYIVFDSAKTYNIIITYKVTATTATAKEDYPEIGIVRNNGINLTADNGSKVIAAQRIAPEDVNKEKTLTATIDGSSYNGYPARLAFTGKGSFEVTSATIAEYENVATVTFINDGISTTDYMLYSSTLPTPVKSGYTFMGWFDANGAKKTIVTGAETLTAAWVKNSDVDLTKSAKIDGTKATMTLKVPTDADTPLNVTIQGFQKLLMDENGVVRTNELWTGGAAVALKYADDNYVEFINSAKYIVNVNYDVTNIGTYDKVYHPQIAIIQNKSTYTQDNGQTILAAKKHSVEVDNASISCIVDSKNYKAIRLAFDGQGSFSIKSVTITEMPADTVGLNTVKYTDSTYSTDATVLAENGTAIADLPRTLLHNFGGWYNGEEKVTTVSGDVTLTAKWFDKYDVTMNGVTDLKDIVRIKKALVDLKTDIVYDIDRDNAVSATDATALRKNLLGIKDVVLDETEVAGYTVVSGDQQSF